MRRLSHCAAALLACSLALLGVPAAYGQAANPVSFHIAERWPVGGAGSWDYLALDANGHRLFVTRENRVDVLDTTSGATTGSIADTPGVHGVALAPRLKRGYTSNGRAATVTVFDLGSLRALKTAKVSGTNPDAIVFEPLTNLVLTFNGGSANASVLDARTLDVVATIALPDKPEFAVADGAGHVFVNIQSERGQLVEIDARARAIASTWRLPGCTRPTGLAFDRAHKRLFSVCGANAMVVTDAASGRHVATLAIGEHPDAAAFDPGLGLVFSSNGDGTLTVVRQDDADHYRVLANVPTQKSARTLAIDPAAHRVYLAAADFAPPAPPTAEEPRPRGAMLPDSFTVLVAVIRHPGGI